MASSTLNIVLPEPFKSYVEAHVEDGSYASPADYVQQLIERQRRHEAAALQKTLDKALAGKEYVITPEELAAGNLINLFRKKLAEDS